jgi:hypothetical protein
MQPTGCRGLSGPIGTLQWLKAERRKKMCTDTEPKLISDVIADSRIKRGKYLLIGIVVVSVPSPLELLGILPQEGGAKGIVHLICLVLCLGIITLIFRGYHWARVLLGCLSLFGSGFMSSAVFVFWALGSSALPNPPFKFNPFRAGLSLMIPAALLLMICGVLLVASPAIRDYVEAQKAKRICNSRSGAPLTP